MDEARAVRTCEAHTGVVRYGDEPSDLRRPQLT
jgi:hypothetical protein